LCRLGQALQFAALLAPNRVMTHAIENYILGAKKSLTISPEFNLSKGGGGTNLKLKKGKL
jgi:hypothetical protein